MCAEEIPADATVCPFCNSPLVGESPPAAAPAPPQAALPVSKPKRTGLVIGLIAAGLAVLCVIAGIIWVVSQGGITAFLPAAATPTRTPRPSSTPNYAATQEQRNENSTATAQAAWVQGFAQPILDDVHSRQPNFEDDFSVLEGKYFRWSGALPGVTFTEDVMHINTGENEWVAASGSLTATDFVLEFDFTPRIISAGSGATNNFRGEEKGGYNFGFNLGDDGCWMGTLPAGQEWGLVAECQSSQVGLNEITSVIIIAKGNQFAFYANNEPLLYVEDGTFSGDYVDIGVYAPNGTAEVDFDNVRFWDLKNLKP